MNKLIEDKIALKSSRRPQMAPITGISAEGAAHV